jgi:hypothetical protein
LVNNLNHKMITLNIPKTWEEFKSMVDVIKSTPFDNLRFPDDQLFYNNYNELVDQTIRHQILFNTFEGKDRIILRNIFPYNNLIKDIPCVINHYCLWSTTGQVPASEVEAEIKSKFPNKDYFWFENDSIVKSIPDIWHCHIFVKEK